MITEETKTITTPAQREQIKKELQKALLKRGFLAKIISIEEVINKNTKKSRIEFETENFQTIPVIFESLRVNNFSSAIYSYNLYKTEEYYYKVMIEVSVSYTIFNGGGNSTTLFYFYCVLSNDGKEIFDVETKF